jgi:hypothetical protein
VSELHHDLETRRPWRRAAAWLLFLGPFFFASYGFANWLASRRTGVGAIAYDWERAIPFVPWTIVPYWSIDLLYAVSIFICTTRRELDRHAQRLLAVQLVSVLCFIVFPLRFSFERPVAEGLFGALFTALGAFDKPFNQAPSLHISLLVVIWLRLAAHLPRAWRVVLHVWMTLIGLSILTTYQHHFIDLPTGILVGLLALWAFPDEGPSPLHKMAFTPDRRRRRLAARYALGALVFGAIACAGGAWLWLVWPAIALAMVALIYALIGTRGFQKGNDGLLTAGASGLLAPYLGAAWLNSRLWTRTHPQPCEVRDGVWIGRVPRGGDAASFAAIVDLCAELPCPARRFYRTIPVLDLTVPDRESLRIAAEAIEEARQHGPVLVCCALGYSRSAAAVVAWLLMTGRAGSAEEAIRLVRTARPTIVLTSEQFA